MLINAETRPYVVFNKGDHFNVAFYGKSNCELNTLLLIIFSKKYFVYD